MHLFIVQPFYSHYYPILYLANELKKNGKKVILTTTPELTPVIMKEGFDCIEIKYLSEYIVRSYRVLIGLLLTNLVSERLINKRETEFENAKKEAEVLVRKYDLSHVYIDQSIAEYYLLFKPYLNNISIVHTKFYSGKSSRVPPFNTFISPSNSILTKIKIRWSWLRTLMIRRTYEFYENLAFYGKSESYYWKKHCKEEGISWHHFIDRNHVLNNGIKNCPNIILAPKGLAFKDDLKNPALKYMEGLYEKNEKNYMTSEYNRFKADFINQPSKKLVYLAFGTLFGNFKAVKKFVHMVIKILCDLPDVTLLISCGNLKLNNIKFDNVIVFPYLPQQDVLKYSDVFITHGGLGSVKEGYFAKVPMLVFPINSQVDQPGNAARVKYNKLGEFVRIGKFTETEVQQKLLGLLSLNSRKFRHHYFTT